MCCDVCPVQGSLFYIFPQWRLGYGFEVVSVCTEREGEETTRMVAVRWNLERFSVKERTCALPALVPGTSAVITSVVKAKEANNEVQKEVRLEKTNHCLPCAFRLVPIGQLDSSSVPFSHVCSPLLHCHRVVLFQFIPFPTQAGRKCRVLPFPFPCCFILPSMLVSPCSLVEMFPTRSLLTS